MALFSLKNIYYSVGPHPLLDRVNLEIQMKERIALIGRNGEGKSTLFRILAQTIAPESGEMLKEPYIRVSRLAQELPNAENCTVYEAVAQGLSELSALLIQYQDLTAQPEGHDEAWMNQVHTLQQRIEQLNGWQIQQRIERVIQDLSLPAQTLMSALSGGWRRRVALAAALVQEPDILLLDEPTNHLDLDAIQWLEKMLINYPKTIIFITHDRALLRALATRIVELDRGKLTSYPANYDLYLERKAQVLLEEERHNALLDKKLSEEEAWIRQGIKARRTRNEGRVRALEALREERTKRRSVKEKPKFGINDPNTSGKTVIQAQNVRFAYEQDKPIIANFSFIIQRGDKIAIVGRNGTGKTTLVKLLMGILKPTQGTIKSSPTNQIAFFDQNREQLDPESTVMANVVEGDDYIDILGKKKHVIGYMEDFLFSPSKCRALAKTLSGGEQNRLMLAKLFAKPANVLVLDEPTNDLDIESLDVLENLLLNYQGTVIIISHDREFIDNVATHCIAFEEQGSISINVGGYSDWLQRQSPIIKTAVKVPQKKVLSSEKKVDVQRKLTLNEKKELQSLPQMIESLEQELKELESLICAPDFYTKPKQEILGINQKVAKCQQAIARTYSRWEELDDFEIR